MRFRPFLLLYGAGLALEAAFVAPLLFLLRSQLPPEIPRFFLAAVCANLLYLPLGLPRGRVEIDREGIGVTWKTWGFPCRRKHLPWANIQWVGPARVFWLRYLVLGGPSVGWMGVSNRKTAIWLPLFVDDLAGLQDAGREFASANHALRLHLKEFSRLGE